MWIFSYGHRWGRIVPNQERYAEIIRPLIDRRWSSLASETVPGVEERNPGK
jgi:hypothetical protein